MLCSHCGREFSGGTVCPFCHSPQMATPTLEATRRVAGSPCMLLASLVYTLSFVLSLVQNIGAVQAQPLMLISALVGLAPSLLFLIGIWRLFAAGRGRGPFFPTDGLTLVKAGVIVMIVYLGIAALILIPILLGDSTVINSVLVTTTLGELLNLIGLYDFDEVRILLTLLFMGLFAASFVYFARIISTMGTVRRNLYAPVPSGKVSILVVVFNFLNAVFLFIRCMQRLFIPPLTSIPFIPIDLPDTTVYTYMAIAMDMASVLALILFSVCILQYRSQIGRLLPSAYQAAYSPAYPQPSASVQPPVYATPGAPAEGQAAPQAAVQAPAAVPAAAVYCRQCGYPLTQQDVSCPRCGTPRE